MAGHKPILDYARPGTDLASDPITPAPHALCVQRDPTLIERAARAMVFLTADWSPQDRVSRKILREAVATMPSEVRFEFFVLSEDDPCSAAWLLEHGWVYKHKVGYGSVLWYEHGRLVAKETFPHIWGATRIVQRTVFLWSPTSGRWNTGGTSRSKGDDGLS